MMISRKGSSQLVEQTASVQKEGKTLMFDPTTKALSDECFKFLLREETKRAIRYAAYFSVLLIEVDQNPSTEFLAALAELIRRRIRRTDLIGRIEQRRFSILLHHAEGQDGYCVAERIRDLVEHYRFVMEDNTCRGSVSVGGACFPTHAPDTQDLLGVANRMLLKARSKGGNRVYLPGQ